MQASLLDALDPYHQLGLTRSLPDHALSSNTPNLSQATVRGGHAKPWTPDSPMFWFAGLLLATAGLIGVSTSARIGPLKTSASLGST